MRIDNLKKMWVCDPYAIEHESWFRSRAVREANQQWKIMRKSLRCVNQVGVVKSSMSKDIRKSSIDFGPNSLIGLGEESSMASKVIQFIFV